MRMLMSSQPRLLHILRAVVKWLVVESGFPESDADCLAMAINEAVANVIRHTYGDCDEAPLALVFRKFPDRVEFLLEDWGPRVDSERIRPRPLDEVRPGGLGTFFISSYMDTCCYDKDFVEGNRLRMVKYFPRKA